MRSASPHHTDLAAVAGFVWVLSSALASVGCSDATAGSSSCADYTPPASFDAQVPTVSFAKDVMPIFARSCAFTSCHGSATGNANGVSLGSDDPTELHRAIVDVRASRLPTMSHVKPGSPRESFLMRKLDGRPCALAAQCTDGDCGQSMPHGEPLLPIEQRDTIRRWIAQGAKND